MWKKDWRPLFLLFLSLKHLKARAKLLLKGKPTKSFSKQHYATLLSASIFRFTRNQVKRSLAWLLLSFLLALNLKILKPSWHLAVLFCSVLLFPSLCEWLWSGSINDLAWFCKYFPLPLQRHHFSVVSQLNSLVAVVEVDSNSSSNSKWMLVVDVDAPSRSLLCNHAARWAYSEEGAVNCSFIPNSTTQKHSRQTLEADEREIK